MRGQHSINDPVPLYSLDFEKRLKYHNSGRVQSTKARRPFRLFGRKDFHSFAEARAAEVCLKRFKDPHRVRAWIVT